MTTELNEKGDALRDLKQALQKQKREKVLREYQERKKQKSSIWDNLFSGKPKPTETQNEDTEEKNNEDMEKKIEDTEEKGEPTEESEDEELPMSPEFEMIPKKEGDILTDLSKPVIHESTNSDFAFTKQQHSTMSNEFEGEDKESDSLTNPPLSEKEDEEEIEAIPESLPESFKMPHFVGTPLNLDQLVGDIPNSVNSEHDFEKEEKPDQEIALSSLLDKARAEEAERKKKAKEHSSSNALDILFEQADDDKKKKKKKSAELQLKSF
eukprot:CAMPEP_0117426218 /NCGR_PEP_ID=MMETSP0758-20121206/6376_1 /TAXON_ID=63605 /ORGANISM="Percolomonas cosmopolitus, Strain AE-1 (ATCC 50343)" /LENGTH=266 /DNA_ID=CAMNT_0005211255 /DNA_START=269 /DNA_END=1069 /DNA_ORIENTATION=-